MIAKNEMASVLGTVTSWPVEDRVLLARKILETVESSVPHGGRGYMAEEVISLLKMPQPARTDTECEQILSEELMRKHGS